jgi:hypothetical protein
LAFLSERLVRTVGVASSAPASPRIASQSRMSKNPPVFLLFNRLPKVPQKERASKTPPVDSQQVLVRYVNEQLVLHSANLPWPSSGPIFKDMERDINSYTSVSLLYRVIAAHAALLRARVTAAAAAIFFAVSAHPLAALSAVKLMSAGDERTASLRAIRVGKGKFKSS